MTRKDGKCNVMTLIEKRARQETRPCMYCKYNEICKGTNNTCPMLIKWRNFRKEAYKQHLKWCIKVMSWKDK